MDGQRQQYIPPPPPPRQPAHIPAQLQSQLQPLVPPPPPGPPPGTTGYGVPQGWQPQSWGKSVLTTGLPPPPPPPQNQQHAPYQPAAMAAMDNLPLTSATYVPGNDTIGGFPPLYDPPGRPTYEPYLQRPTAPQPYLTEASYNPQTPGGRIGQPHVYSHTAGPDQSHYGDSQFPSSSTQGTPSHGVNLVKSPSYRQSSGNGSLAGLSPGIAASQWPLERVLQWLAKNGFSQDWQETFKSLELQGADFLELGLAWNGRGNLGKIHRVVYPQLQKECARRGVEYDQAREREEGRRIRQLIRHLNEGSEDTVSTPLQGEPPVTIPGPADNAYATYNPKFIPEPRSAGANGKLDFTAEQQSLAQRPSTANVGKPGSQMRSFTTPISAHPHHDSPLDSPSREPTTWLRSDYTRGVLAGLGEHRRQSPSTSSEVQFHPGSSSPKSGSPAMHTDSTAAAGRNTGRYYEQHRVAQEANRQSPQDSTPGRPLSGESTSTQREPSKGIREFFKKKTKSNTSNHASPEEPSSEYPTTPEPSTLYSVGAYSNSDLSLGERPSSSSKPKTKKWIFATTDGVNYRLIDVTDYESVETLRAVICKNLEISDWASAQIFLTEPGQTEHDEPVNDTNLAIYRRRKSDAYGSLKLFVHGTSDRATKNRPHNFNGLGVSIPSGGEKPALSPVAIQTPIHRKPLDEDALQRISPQNPKPSSPLLNSRQPTLRLKSSKNDLISSQDSQKASDTDNADIAARHESYLLDVERKQRENHISRHRKPTYGETGYRGGFVDFDLPRVSPYEERRLSSSDEKKPETLVPLRKPPVAPNESNTLTKVNSLRKAPGQRERLHLHTHAQNQASHGLGAVLASVGRMTSAIGTPIPSGRDSSSPSSANRDSVSSESERAHTGDSAGTASSRTTLGKFRDKKHKLPCTFFWFFKTLITYFVDSGIASKWAPDGGQRSPSFVPPASARPSSVSSRPSIQSRKSFGPVIDFEEQQVSFQETSRAAAEASDDDSDDGLFMVPLANNKPQNPEPQTQVNSEEKPVLSVDTKQKPGRYLVPPSSPDEEKPPPDRRHSFASGDLWASRPPVEGVIDNLDSFFPGVDLDAPYLGEPQSPSSKGKDSDGDATMRPKQEYPAPPPMPPTDPVARPGTGNAARQIMSRNNGGGGLGRAKSIRDIARGAAVRTKSVNASPQRSNVPLRRKSTKMFGAKIIQMSPKPGSRLSNLDPIPQSAAHQASSSASQPQPTFRIIRGELIGKGTYGRVYLGINADNGEVLAVKQVEINPRVAGTDRDKIKEMVAALDQEIDTMQHLEHANIVQYLGCERGEFSISIYLEYISGGSIGSCLRKHGKFQESVVKSLTRQTLSGLAYLHEMGILHRDLKADNILLDVDGTCKISDFGISKKTNDIYVNDSSNSMQGTVFWMAPEVIQSQGQGYSAKVDIWSLGCVVLEMFAGRRPWSKEEAIGAIFKLGSLGQAPPHS
ncbi:hypothetical protein N7470_002064 [Penicillium chermesinum]|nr:hypothetical protein N7470_002064 [Penicillium chermesinum]